MNVGEPIMTRRLPAVLALLLSAGVLLSAQSGAPREPPQEPQSFKFRTGVELINVNATVTDQSGRFVSGLTKDDFRVFEDEQAQPVTHFNAERVPVSLGIVLDTSGSMDGDKMYAAKQALERFLFQLIDPEDEVFLYRFDNSPELVEGWTRDKRRVSDALRRIQPRGGTALYDAVADAVHLAQQGRNKKKAVVIISDGNDTSSRTDIFAVKQLIRETEVLVYAIGIDASGTPYGGNDIPPSPTVRSVRRRCSAAVRRGRPRCRFPLPGRPPSESGSAAGAAATAAERSDPGRRQFALEVHRQRRSRQRRGAPRYHRRQRRPHRDRSLDARSRSRHRGHRR